MNKYNKPLIIGHRGAKGYIMENTMESILHAIDLGVDGIEFDVQMCRTGEIVAFHDLTLDRLAFKDQFYFEKTKGKNISELHWYQIYNTELIDSMGRKYKIPKLLDILRHPKVYNSDILINIDIKDNKSPELIAEIISELIDEGLYEADRFMVSSWSLEDLIYLFEFKEESKLKDPKFRNFKIGWILFPENIPYEGLSNSIKKCSKVLTHIVLCRSLINQPIIDTIRDCGLSIFVYTINSRDDYPLDNFETLVDGIISNKPDYI